MYHLSTPTYIVSRQNSGSLSLITGTARTCSFQNVFTPGRVHSRTYSLQNVCTPERVHSRARSLQNVFTAKLVHSRTCSLIVLPHAVIASKQREYLRMILLCMYFCTCVIFVFMRRLLVILTGRISQESLLQLRMLASLLRPKMPANKERACLKDDSHQF